MQCTVLFSFFFFNDTATTEIYTLSLHDALPISPLAHPASRPGVAPESAGPPADGDRGAALSVHRGGPQPLASTLERDSQTLPRCLAPRRRSRRARETHRVRRAVRAAAHRIDGERDAHRVNLRHWPRRTVMALIRVYQVTLAHLVFTQCRFVPSCSRYTFEAVERYGAVRGAWLGIRRILRCHPLHPGGYDPVP